MNARAALEMVALALAVMGSIVAAILSWAQMRSQISSVSERVAELRAKAAELDGARMRQVERFKDIESALERLNDRIDGATGDRDLSRPVRRGPT